MCERELPPKNRRGVPFESLASDAEASRPRKLCEEAPQNAARAPHRSPLASNTLSNARKSKRGAKRCAHRQKKQSPPATQSSSTKPDESRQAHYRARAPRPARRRWRRSVRTGVYVGRASRLRRRASRAAHRALTLQLVGLRRPRRRPRPRRRRPRRPCRAGAPPAFLNSTSPSKTPLQALEQVWSRQRCASAALRPTSGPDNATALGRGPCDARLARGLPRRAQHHMAALEQQS